MLLLKKNGQWKEIWKSRKVGKKVEKAEKGKVELLLVQDRLYFSFMKSFLVSSFLTPVHLPFFTFLKIYLLVFMEAVITYPIFLEILNISLFHRG